MKVSQFSLAAIEHIPYIELISRAGESTRLEFILCVGICCDKRAIACSAHA